MSIQNHTPLAILSASNADTTNIGTVDGRPADVAGGQWFLDAPSLLSANSDK